VIKQGFLAVFVGRFNTPLLRFSVSPHIVDALLRPEELTESGIHRIYKNKNYRYVYFDYDSIND